MAVPDRLQSNMEVVLDETCRSLANGGDHACRRAIAEQPLQAAEAGQYTLSGLRAVAHRALASQSVEKRAPGTNVQG